MATPSKPHRGQKGVHLGRNKKSIDPKIVERLAKYGSPAAEIAAILGCDERTIERRFATVLKKSHENLKHMLRSKLVRQAIGGDTACLIFATKCLVGLKEPRDDALNVQLNMSTIVVTAEIAQDILTRTKAADARLDKFFQSKTPLRANGQVSSN